MTEDKLEFKSQLGSATRVVLFFCGLFPGIAPYELIIKPGWTSYANPFFILSLLISLGAIAIGLIFIAASVIGLDEIVQFDRSRKRVVHQFGAPLVKWRIETFPFSEIKEMRVEAKTFDDSPDRFRIRLDMHAGQPLRFGDFVTREDAERVQTNIRNFIL